MTTKMPSESPALPAQTEKPPHYTYLKEFRTQQCPLFLQHKCASHRPFTCFHWHFMNQRRRRPVRKRDGTFSYSPDIYCTKFDETSGICPDGDECPFLHRTAGDTERRYHLRYYKTGTCVYETDTKGHCVKNGPHCAFAHGQLDLRTPVYDIRELQTSEQTSDISSSPGTPNSSSLEKDRLLLEDPRWNDTNFVLANYKTETCKKSPRLCRQGYACPHFHNARDRRRSPKVSKYRSTPCPNVKHGDDWGDPTQCENGDNCGYCHTRTEQQFHPEIYKSTKCNDMVQTNSCPRGPFCAFAHVEQEITTQREILKQDSSLLAAMIQNLLPQTCNVSSTAAVSLPQCTSAAITTMLQLSDVSSSVMTTCINSWTKMPDPIGKERTNGVSSNLDVSSSVMTTCINSWTKMPDPIGKERTNGVSSNVVTSTNDIGVLHNNNHPSSPQPETIGKDRSSSTSSSTASIDGGFSFLQRVSMSDRDELQQMKLHQQLQAIDNDLTLDINEKTKRKQNLLLVHNLNSGAYSSLSGLGSTSMTTGMSLFATSFYPSRDTVGSVIEQALEDITLDDIDINNLDKELDNDTNSLGSSISAGLSSGFSSSSIPIGIPPCSIPRGSVGSLSQSPTSPYGSFHSILPLHSQRDTHCESFLGHYNHMKFTGSPFAEVSCSVSPRSGPGGTNSPLYSQSVTNSLNVSQSTDIQKLQSDVMSYKTKLDHWEQAYNQAKAACEAWKKEAEDSLKKMKVVEEEKMTVIKQRDETLNQYKKLKIESASQKVGSNHLHSLTTSDLESLILPQLHHLQQQLRSDLDKVEQVIYKQSTNKCVICLDTSRSVTTSPCNHCVMCDKCAAMETHCPLCNAQIKQQTSVNYHHM